MLEAPDRDADCGVVHDQATAVREKTTPVLPKPCAGKLSLETQRLLLKNRGHARQRTHACQTCGRMVGVQEAVGRWVPERHLPSAIPVSLARPSEDELRDTLNAKPPQRQPRAPSLVPHFAFATGMPRTS